MLSSFMKNVQTAARLVLLGFDDESLTATVYTTSFSLHDISADTGKVGLINSLSHAILTAMNARQYVRVVSVS